MGTNRYTNDYAVKGSNAFIYAHPAMEYPAPVPTGAWTTNEDEWRTTLKDLQNNHYALVNPQHIYNSVGAGYVPFFNSWPGLIASGADASGDVNGGVMAVNAGTTPGILYQRPITLERGKYYKLTYQLWVENAPVRLKTNMLSSDGIIGLGTSLGELNGGASAGVWSEQVQYFYLPPAICTDNTYIINLQNHQQANSGNDFAIDNVVLIEIDASDAGIASANVVEAPCTDGLDVPATADDESLGNVSGTAVRINVLANDLLKDGSGASINSTEYGTSAKLDKIKKLKLEFIVPSGEGYALNSGFVDGESIDGLSSKLTVFGEGVWEFKNEWVAGEHQFYVEFTPAPGFVGNPTSVQYTIKEYDAVADRPIDNGITSAPATVTVTYVLPSNPVATDDYETVDPIDGSYIDAIFDNDEIDGIGTNHLAGNIVEVAHPFNDGAIYRQDAVTGALPDIVVPGEGTWSYDATSGEFTFVPEPTYTNNPTPIYYRFQEAVNDVRSNWAGIFFETPDGPLPVSLVDFQAILVNQSVVLNWETAQEKNNKGFYIERSENGKQWQVLGFVKSKADAGNSNSSTLYSFTDNAAISGTNFYRLKQIDIDGKFDYSEMRMINIAATSTGVQLYPNPAKDAVTIAGLTAGKSIDIYNSIGQLVKSVMVNQSLVSLATADWAAGYYYIHTTDNTGKISVQKLVVVR